MCTEDVWIESKVNRGCRPDSENAKDAEKRK